jgi:hypothetical protein
MASSKLQVSDFDFDTIKANLKTFLQSQTEFQDYNFEGSGMSVLLDILAYNTHYLGYNANMLANEMFLDSADIRKNIVSLAKGLGYIPSSVISPQAVINIVVNDATGSSLILPKGTSFSTTVNGTNFQYVTKEDYSATIENNVYTFNDVSIYEGTLVTYRYVVDSNDPDQKFVIPSQYADMSTLNVVLQNSATDTTSRIFTELDVNAIQASKVFNPDTNVGNNSLVYLKQENEDGRYEIYFGDNVIGKKPDDGNIVILQYIVTNATLSNGATTFSINNAIQGFSNITITTTTPSFGGALAESKESIRYNAPLFYGTQNRAVTSFDYEALVKKLVPAALSVKSWGSENDEYPSYGNVKIAIKLDNDQTLTVGAKSLIALNLKNYNIASIRPVIVDPTITYVMITSNILFNSSLTTKTADTIRSLVIENLIDYNQNTLQRFDSVLRFSKLTKLIDNTDSSIDSNITTLKIKQRLIPVLGSSLSYSVYFRNALYNPTSGYNEVNGGILQSSAFKINGDPTNIYYLNDDGNGKIRLYTLVSTGLTDSAVSYVNTNQGTINYATGEILINSLNISSIEPVNGNEVDYISLTVKSNSNDIVPVRDQVVEIDFDNSVISVEKNNYVGGSSVTTTGVVVTSRSN